MIVFGVNTACFPLFENMWISAILYCMGPEHKLMYNRNEEEERAVEWGSGSTHCTLRVGYYKMNTLLVWSFGL